MTYEDFLARKVKSIPDAGFEVAPGDIHPSLFPFQRDIVQWACRRGKAALFEAYGLGKTRQELEWGRLVCEKTGGAVLNLCPLAVAQQTIREAERIGIRTKYVKTQREITGPGIWLTNYDRLDAFDPSEFVGIVADESGILKSFTGATKELLCEFAARLPYRLAATATPSPNDVTELGNHSEFLGIMPSGEMLTRWFINDTSEANNLRLKKWAIRPFWDWVSSWAVCISAPSDLGYSDDGYILPPLQVHRHIVDARIEEDPQDGKLFRQVELNATGLHREMRRTVNARAVKVAELVNSDRETWAVWVNTNYEADEVKALIPGAVEVRGSETPEIKERKLLSFCDGTARVIISKPRIFGYGLNLQHCCHTAYVGMSYSWEAFDQSLHRFYRFGQTRPVHAHVVMAETEVPIWEVVQAKAVAHREMQLQMVLSVHSLDTLGNDLRLNRECGDRPIVWPEWVRTQEEEKAA